MITLVELLTDVIWYNSQKLNLENEDECRRPVLRLAKHIQPREIPERDWPRPEPNKRVIIIDI